ncbi:MAG: HAD family phosphatase [Oscillospiraceae bacterium]|nr:HAD family phosphatase [Oscillospiraceae bacterium]
MNFIFDIGNVLINFKPLLFLEELFGEKAVADKLFQTIFQSPEWRKLDQGLLTHQEAEDIFCMREPELQPEIHQTMQNLKNLLTPIPETVALLPKIKELGHKLYYLSDFHAELRSYIFDQYPFFALFDGGVFSCDIHVTKPSPAIYRHLLETYQLAPKDCLFFDDVEKNVAGAQAEGIHSVLFTGAACVAPYITSEEERVI